MKHAEKKHATITVQGTNKKAIKSVLVYMEPPENTLFKANGQMIKDFENELELIKNVNEVLIKYNRSHNHAELKMRSYYTKLKSSFSGFLTCLFDDVLKNDKSTFLFCVSSVTGFTQKDKEQILANKDLLLTYDDRVIVFTDCANKKERQQQQIPEELTSIFIRPPIFLGLYKEPIGSPMFMLKYTGDSQYGLHQLGLIFAVQDILYLGLNIVRLCLAPRFPFYKWRCFNCEALKK